MKSFRSLAITVSLRTEQAVNLPPTEHGHLLLDDLNPLPQCLMGRAGGIDFRSTMERARNTANLTSDDQFEAAIDAQAGEYAPHLLRLFVQRQIPVQIVVFVRGQLDLVQVATALPPARYVLEVPEVLKQPLPFLPVCRCRIRIYQCRERSCFAALGPLLLTGITLDLPVGCSDGGAE